METTALTAHTPTDRDASGRFAPGNKLALGRGNPHADRALAWRRAVVDAVEPDELRAVVRVLVEKALKGERWAVRELLDRCLGKPTQTADVAVETDTPMHIELRFPD